MTIKLTLHTQPEAPLEAETISVDRLAGLKTTEIEKQTLHHGNQQQVIADFFTVTGESDPSLSIQGDLSRIKHLGDVRMVLQKMGNLKCAVALALNA